MKALVVKEEPEFQPVSITFTFETKNELNVLYDLLNWTGLVERGLGRAAKPLRGVNHSATLYDMWRAITNSNGWPFRH